jgi:hypothetical protein
MAKALIVEIDVEFAQFTPVSKDQQTQAMQLWNREAGCIALIQDVGAVLVVIAV